MIVVRIPKKIGNRDLTNFVTIQVKKFKKNQRHRYIQLRGEVAYSKDYVYFVFPDYALELAFALSILFKCEKRSIPCALEIGKPLDSEKIPRDVLEAARVWAGRKLHRKYYRLRDIELH